MVIQNLSNRLDYVAYYIQKGIVSFMKSSRKRITQNVYSWQGKVREV